MITRPGNQQNRPLKSCKLFVKNEMGTSSRRYEIHVNETRSIGEKVETTKVDQISTFDAKIAVDFLTRHGVHQNEITYAGQAMDEMGHNVASFGFFGGFISSSFEGVNQ